MHITWLYLTKILCPIFISTIFYLWLYKWKIKRYENFRPAKSFKRNILVWNITGNSFNFVNSLGSTFLQPNDYEASKPLRVYETKYLTMHKIFKKLKKYKILKSAWIGILAIFSHDKINFLTHVFIVNIFALCPVYSLTGLK